MTGSDSLASLLLSGGGGFERGTHAAHLPCFPSVFAGGENLRRPLQPFGGILEDGVVEQPALLLQQRPVIANRKNRGRDLCAGGIDPHSRVSSKKLLGLHFQEFLNGNSLLACQPFLLHLELPGKCSHAGQAIPQTAAFYFDRCNFVTACQHKINFCVALIPVKQPDSFSANAVCQMGANGRFCRRPHQAGSCRASFNVR